MPLEYPRQDYYPSAKLRLTIRLDEFGNPTRLKAPPPKPTKSLDGVIDPRAGLVVISDPGAPAGITRYLVADPSQSNTPVATNQSRSNDSLTFDVSVIPGDMDWSVNGIRTADTLSAKIKYIDCPVHPMAVRSIAVEALIGTVSDLEFAKGIRGTTRSGFGNAGEGESLRIIQDTYLDSNGIQRSNLRFQGWVDKWEAKWSASDEPYIHITCRDNTQLLIDQAAPVTFVIASALPIDKAIAQYLAHFPQFQGLSVEYRPNTDTPPTLDNVLLGTAHRPRLGPQPSWAGGSSGKLSVWDYLTDVCGAIGHVIRVEGTNIIIQTARSITTSSVLRRSDDPFKGRTLTTGVHFDYRRFIYGKNIEEMNFARTFTRNVPKNIEVRCYNSEAKKLLVARFPASPADRIKWALPGDAKTDQKWEVIRVSGIRDPAMLMQIAQTAYEQMGRNEMTVEVKTKNLASFGGGNLDPDILDMKAGDTFEVLVARRDTDNMNMLNNIESLLISQQKNAEFMKTLGFSDDFANAYAKAYTDAGFLTLFRLRSMKVKWSIENGISITVQGINYIEVRADKSLPDGQEPGTTQTGTTTSPVSVNQGNPTDPPLPTLTQDQISRILGNS